MSFHRHHRIAAIIGACFLAGVGAQALAQTAPKAASDESGSTAIKPAEKGDLDKTTDEKPADKSSDSQAEAEDAQPQAPRVNVTWEFSRANQLATAGGFTRAIPHYENVLKAAPERYTQAYYNLAEMHRLKKECDKAVLLYSIYLHRESGEENLADGEKALKECLNARETGSLSVELEPAGQAQLRVNGYLVDEEDGVQKLKLLPGDYQVEVTAKDHLNDRKTINIKANDDIEEVIALEKMLFYGSLKLNLTQKDAKIKIEPKTLDSKRAETRTHQFSAPMDEPLKLATGKYFVEVTLPGHRRWIRNIDITRDEVSEIDIRLTRQLPDAIRK